MREGLGPSPFRYSKNVASLPEHSMTVRTLRPGKRRNWSKSRVRGDLTSPTIFSCHSSVSTTGGTAKCWPRLMTTLERTRLLIIDDWGPEPLNAEQRRDLLEIVDDRYDRGSLLITSQVPVNRWHELRLEYYQQSLGAEWPRILLMRCRP